MIATRIGYDLRYAHARAIIDATFGSRCAMGVRDTMANKLVFDHELDVASFNSVVLYIRSKNISDVHLVDCDVSPVPCVVVSDYDLPGDVRKDLVINMPAFGRLGKARDDIVTAANVLKIDGSFTSLANLLTAAGYSGGFCDQLYGVCCGELPVGTNRSVLLDLYRAMVSLFRWLNGQILINGIVDIENVPLFDTELAVGNIGCDITLCHTCVAHSGTPCECVVGLQPPTSSSVTSGGSNSHCYVVLFPKKCWSELVAFGDATVSAPVIDQLYQDYGSNPKGEYVLLKYYDYSDYAVYYHVVNNLSYYSIYKHNPYFRVVSMGSARDIIMSYCHVGSGTSRLGILGSANVENACSDGESLMVTRMRSERRRFPGIIRIHYYVVSFVPGINTYRYMLDSAYWNSMCNYGVLIMEVSTFLRMCGQLDRNDRGMGAVVRYSRNPVYTTFFVYRFDDDSHVPDRDIAVNTIYSGRMSTVVGFLRLAVDRNIISGTDRIR